MYSDDSSQSSDSSMTYRSSSRFSPAAASGARRSRQSKSRNLQKYAPSAIPSFQGGSQQGGAMTTTASAAARERRKRVLFAGTMVCAVGAATTLSNTFDFDIDFSFSTSPAGGTTTARKAGGLRAGSTSRQNFQRRLELASAEYMSGSVGGAPEDIVNFLAKYGLEMKDLELMAQLKGVKVDESVSTSSTGTTSSTTFSTTAETTLDGSSTSSTTTEETSDGDASAALLSSLLGGSSEESTTEEGDETSTESTTAEDASGGLNSLLSSFLGSSSGTEEASTTTEEDSAVTSTESTTEETSTGSASPLDLASLMGSVSSELSSTETEAESQPEEALSLESLMSSSTSTAETASVETTSTESAAPPALNPEQQAMMMQMMASGSMTPDQQQQMMEMMLGQSAGDDTTTTDSSTTTAITSTDSSVIPTATDVVATSTSASTMAFESTANAAPGFGVSALANFKNAWEPWDPSEIPTFFHIPKAGGSSVKDNIGSCHRFTMATEYGVTDGHDQDTEIAVVYPAGGPPGSDRSPFVNVDTTTVAGIQRAKEMGFADAGLADAVVTGFLYEANDLFTPTAKGRMFTVFRHPIERAISMFYYIQVADWEPTYSPELKDWTIEQYAESDRIENNWMTRQLSGQLSGDLNDDALAVAMEVIRSKFLVGLMTEMDRTMERFEKFFRWKYRVNPENQEACRERLMSGGSNSNSANKKEQPKEGDIAWEKLMWQNQYDMQLYDFIVELFEEQEALVSGMPDGYRLIDATCCKCDPPTFPPEGYECPKSIPN